ncbi:MAG TPA: polysulfide reductase NrfD [Candidatus Hydrogenedentes bacterium]|nr:polysulfide reductase NrfD [Candidatus Hydrogenedentota bacterium]HOV75090.1 polysulfide reductase NrfD [Candidatus Hydrogenedentota bacterium]HPC18009.1 polysulfide reductase NrfD [Candidatus Hydrogenedentota bacterium]HRT21233.1 polysulfide reductase NrfD [Candidatus Hydrogenedentota bacterium]HRT66483.1 polysulfide reductase NrfD [Candidatus Hydrogenedentota bacterium]
MHHEHEIVPARLVTWRLVLLALLMVAGAAAFVARFAYGLGVTTNLSDNYPWGLWIVFDLVWIALAGGAFATAGLVYVFMAREYHPLARPAVWMGFLSYSFVVVTLLADLGRPWNFYHLILQRPEHSAMYEVSWCVGLYVTILALEFAPTLFERFKWQKLHDLWRVWSPVYTVAALSVFVFLMSHSLAMAALALVIFTAVAHLTRDSHRETGVPIILIVAAVTLSTMHQSSLGSIFLLMRDKLSAFWWSPAMPVLFFFSAVVSGFALVMLMDVLISYFFRRPYQWNMLAGMGKILWGVLGVYLALRFADIVYRGQFAALFAGAGHAAVAAGHSGDFGWGGAARGADYRHILFIVEIVVGGIVPLVLLSFEAFRKQRVLLLCGALLALGGVVFNRLNVVLLGMNLPGTQPGGLVGTYYPSLIEWVLSLSLIAAAVFFFATGVKLLPILPKAQRSYERA